MLKPRFKVSNLDFTIEHPDDWDDNNMMIEDTAETVGGTTLTDVLSRKYDMTLKYKTMTKADFDALENAINQAVIKNLNIMFSWEKWSHSASLVECKVRLSPRKFTAGSGNSFFYSQVEIKVKEVFSRL